ncbi:O-fucosyltransferase 38-like isoform X5 [Panicum virgatum]|uniref:O-fucosyltransferase family protein n=1 Tax=Panicum virgatum TaxID=38727 RepID=A0A8T0TSW7_PANVG|nr:O-fucosyltransferase 38-like isoform X5 [Panicum virgatum]KAG2615221.1 hypothetical protein PVAP13_3NG069390 [Panicum virgatum]KAG2615222.1 hypothetical protein PVAP13_3NG069390 [Panicum virgatum]
MANPRGAPPLLHPRHRRLMRSPISRCACLLFSFAVLLLLSALRQVARVDLPSPDAPRQGSSENLWASNGYGYNACITPTSRYKVPGKSDRYMTVRSNGGLNQMHTGVVHIPKSDSRLANNGLPIDIQRLRCRCLYQALRFSDPIEDLGKKLVDRLRYRGKFIALHLRYEKDMLAFTGCTYGLSDLEANELTIMRERTSHWKLKDINSTEQRSEGNCPLTPNEVGIFLRAMGYPESTWIYLAAGEIYGGDKYISKLRSYFPNLVSKEMLATKEELEKFNNHASQVAALDYIISVESDVFVPSHSGNMAKAVEGHRRFLGHRKTITPNRRGLVELFDLLEKGDLMEGPQLSSLVTDLHKYRQGAPRKRYGSLPGSKGRARLRTEESFYENPLPECICLTGKH